MMMTRPELAKYIREQADLACTYLEDGAHHTAANRLEGLGREVSAWATKVDRQEETWSKSFGGGQ
jgi:hypothetical protein